MKYTVIITEGALGEIDDAYLWLLQRTPLHAPRWHEELLEAINSLDENPLRFPLLAADQDPLQRSRQLLFGNKHHAYRVIFEVEGTNVFVYQLIHGAKDR